MLVNPKCILTVGHMWCDNVRGSFMDSFVDMLMFSQRTLCKENEYIHVIHPPFSYHALARNYLVENMRGEYLLQLDTDHKFQPDLLARLLEIQKKSNAGVVSGLYCTKHPPHNPVANFWTSDGRCVPMLEWDRNADYFPIGPCGGGALLVTKETFQQVGTNPFDIVGGFSEDYSFFARCRAKGILTVLAPKVQSNHVIETCIAAEDYVPIPGATRAKINEKGEIIEDTQTDILKERSVDEVNAG